MQAGQEGWPRSLVLQMHPDMRAVAGKGYALQPIGVVLDRGAKLKGIDVVGQHADLHRPGPLAHHVDALDALVLGRVIGAMCGVLIVTLQLSYSSRVLPP